MVLYEDTFDTDLAKFGKQQRKYLFYGSLKHANILFKFSAPTRYHGMLYNSYYEGTGDDCIVDMQRLQIFLREFEVSRRCVKNK